MGTVYRCPGVTESGRGLTATTVHVDDCCARFALMSPQQRAETGLQVPTYSGHAEARMAPPPPAGISVRQLVDLVAELQRHASEHPDVEPGDTTVWVDIAPDEDLVEVLALIDLGRPYGLVVGWRRVHNPSEESA